MKALIRNEGETVTEDMEITGIDWSTGYPLTGAKWFGGPYTMVQNYIAPVEDQEASYEEIVSEPQPEISDVYIDESVDENGEDYIVIGGVRYTKEELRRMIE